MHLIILGLLLYVIFAEWRNMKQAAALKDLEKKLEKYKKDKTLWYSGVLPAADKMCLFEEAKGGYALSSLDDKRWLKNGEADFLKISRWIYIDDLKNL